MKTNLNVKPVYRSILACAIGLSLGLGGRLAKAQDAAVDAPATEVEYVEEPAEDSPAEYEEEAVEEYFGVPLKNYN